MVLAFTVRTDANHSTRVALGFWFRGGFSWCRHAGSLGWGVLLWSTFAGGVWVYAGKEKCRP